ncbi:MAG: YDG domain-containing protein [Sheuella sp.]|nr:YDG domain-containing protein [Sheuella sp.]
MTINQSSNRAAINWSSFDIAANATVNFVQPDSSAVALNRVNSSNPSQIYGNLNANGQIYLMNPAGVYFAPGASVNVGGIVATTHQMTDAEFMAGSTTFSRNGATGSIINEGNINSGIGGYIAMLAPEVRNGGVLVAQQGSVAMAAGETVTLNFGPTSKLESLTVSASQLGALVENRHAIRAPGGVVILSSQATNQLAGSVINTGTIEANGITQDGGRIVLSASGSIDLSGSLSVNAAANSSGNGGVISVIADLANPNSIAKINGSISARAGDLGGAGGKIETSGSNVKISANTTIDTRAPNGINGDWLIDPADFSIGSSNTGSVAGETASGDISGDTLSAALVASNVSILSSKGSTPGSGDINVNDAVSWGANRLTLNAAHSININAVMTASGTSSLVMNTSVANGADAAVAGGSVNTAMNTDGSFKGKVNFDRSGTGFLTINGGDYTVINSLGSVGSTTGNDLQGMNGNLTGLYALGANINAEASSGWNSGAGFMPVGTVFSGTFNGLGHTISNLTINRPALIGTGLFATTSGTAPIMNVGLLGGSVTGAGSTGGLVGIAGSGGVSNSFNTGTVTGGAGTGGLAGTSGGGSITNSYTKGAVIGLAGTGGVAGVLGTGDVTASTASGNVTGSAQTGGLVGSLTSGSVTSSSAIGNVSGAAGTGGLIGVLLSGNVRDSFATGIVNGHGGAGVGGLVGVTDGNITNSYSTASSVSGGAGVGGLLGSTTIGNVDGSYSNVATVTGNAGTGGLIGSVTSGTVNNSYAITTMITGAAGTGGLTGSLTSGNVSNVSSTAVTIVGAAGTGGLIGSVTSANIINSSATAVNITGAASTAAFTGTATTGTAVNSYATVSGSITSADGVVPLSQSFTQAITVTANNVSKIYDASAYAGGNGVTYSAAMSMTPTGTLTYTGTSQGAVNASALGYLLTPGGLVNNASYVFTYASGALLIAQAALSISGTTIAVNKTYDTTTAASVSGGTLSGVFAADAAKVSLSQTGSFATANAGSGIQVTATNTLVSVGSDNAANNYFLTAQPAVTTLATISKAPLTVTGTTVADNIIYDGTPDVALNGGILNGVIGSDVGKVTMNQTGNFVTFNVGNGIQVIASNTLGGGALGNASANYEIAQQPVIQALANISPAPITVTGVTNAVNKVYDGTTAATFVGGYLNGIVSGDIGNVSLNQNGSFATPNPGNNIQVHPGMTLSGSAATNYFIAQPIGTYSAMISPVIPPVIPPVVVVPNAESAGNPIIANQNSINITQINTDQASSASLSIPDILTKTALIDNLAQPSALTFSPVITTNLNMINYQINSVIQPNSSDISLIFNSPILVSLNSSVYSSSNAVLLAPSRGESVRNYEVRNEAFNKAVNVTGIVQ